MDSSILINKGTAEARMAEILAETDSLLADMEAEYGALATSLAKSKGDFIEALKEQLTGEKELVSEACTFFRILLQMMQAAGTDFNTLDNKYADQSMN